MKLNKTDRWNRFLEKTKQVGDCLIWCGSKVKFKKLAYGQFWNGEKIVLAHRYAFEEAHRRSIRKGLTIDHICDNSLCVNPKHLREMSLKDNILRSQNNPSAINSRKTHCGKGHEFSKSNTAFTRHGWRRCRKCHNIISLDYQRRKRGWSLADIRRAKK